MLYTKGSKVKVNLSSGVKDGVVAATFRDGNGYLAIVDNYTYVRWPDGLHPDANDAVWKEVKKRAADKKAAGEPSYMAYCSNAKPPMHLIARTLGPSETQSLVNELNIVTLVLDKKESTTATATATATSDVASAMAALESAQASNRVDMDAPAKPEPKAIAPNVDVHPLLRALQDYISAEVDTEVTANVVSREQYDALRLRCDALEQRLVTVESATIRLAVDLAKVFTTLAK